jgi:hypothetical protein
MNTPEEIPEPRLRDDFIRRKDAHTVDFGSRLGLRGQMTPDDLEFLKAHLRTENEVSIIQLSSFQSTLSHVSLAPHQTTNNSTISY